MIIQVRASTRLILVVVQVRAVKTYVAVVEALRKKKRHRMKLSLPPKLVKNWFGAQLFCFVKFSFPNYALDSLLC